jgi:glycosyltransferase involved in cell wall biosynthesis
MSILKLLNAAKDSKLNISFYPIFFESLVSRARNAAVAHFLEDKENTHILFIDSDIVFEPEDVFKLLQSGKEVVAGIYPKKYIVWDRLKQHPEAERVDFPVSGNVKMTEDNFLEMDYLPTGFLLISRTAINKIIKAYPELKYKNDIDGYMSAGDNFYDLFKVGIRNGIYESEDWGFCSLWKSVGGKVLIHPEINVKHLGWHEYSGNLLNYIIGMGK